MVKGGRGVGKKVKEMKYWLHKWRRMEEREKMG